jgi:hypothetical protein
VDDGVGGRAVFYDEGRKMIVLGILLQFRGSMLRPSQARTFARTMMVMVVMVMGGPVMMRPEGDGTGRAGGQRKWVGEIIKRL